MVNEEIVCEACGEKVPVDRSLGVAMMTEPFSSPAAGRCSISEGNMMVKQRPYLLLLLIDGMR